MRLEYKFAERLLSAKKDSVAKVSKQIISELKLTNTITSTKLYLSKIRSVIKAKNKKHPALIYLKLSKKEYRNINKEYHFRVIHRQTGFLVPLNPKPLLDTAQSLLEHDDWRDLALGLMLVTGRRPVEILHLGSFKSCKHPDKILFSGQAKTRNRPGTRTTPYSIPILSSSKKIIAAWKKLRIIKHFSSAQQINGEATNLGSRCRIVYGFSWTPRLLRAAYAATCFYKFTPARTSRLSYYASILGHKLHKDNLPDLDTALSYERFEVNSDSCSPSQKKLKGN